MKTFDKVLIAIFGAILLTAGLLIGRYLFPSIPEPKIEVKERIITDTVKVEKTITIFQKTKPVIVKDTAGNLQTIADSIEGTKDEVEYKIKHTLYGDKEIPSDWEINLKPMIKIVKEYVVKDSIQTIVDTRYIPKPFFADTWFYVSCILTVITIFALSF